MANTNENLKNILFAHSAGDQGSPGNGSFDFVSTLKKELSNEYEIHFPLIENPEAPTYEMWRKLFASEFRKLNESVILVGHSLGGSTLLKYLSEEKPKISISGLFLVAIPHWGENDWNIDEYVLKENFEATLAHIPNIFMYHSKDDDIVPFEHLEFYKKAFPHATVRVLQGEDHAFAKGLPDLVSDIKAL